MEKITIGSALSELRRRAGLSLNAVARAAGYSGPSSVQTFFHPDYDPPALDLAIAHKLAAALEGQGKPPITPEEIFNLVRVGTSRVPLPGKSGAVPEFEFTNTITVYDTKHGGRRAWRMNSRLKTLEYFSLSTSRSVRTFPPQPGLGAAYGAFAIYVAGDSMSPKYRDGEPIFVDPTRSAARGEDVLVLLNDHDPDQIEGDFSLAIIGLLVRRGEEDLLIRQHNPARSARIPVSAVSDTLRIIPWAEVCGASYA